MWNPVREVEGINMTLNFAKTVRKMMGWCPNVTQARYRSMQPVDFINPSQTPSGRSNVENVQSKNVMFPAYNFLLSICFSFGISLILQLSIHLDYAVLIPIIVAIYSFLYLFVIKTFQASVSIDENGVHLKSFMFKNITLDYNDIRSVTPKKPMKPIKFSTKIKILLAIPLTFVIALFTYSMVAYGEWQWILAVIPLLPGSLFLKYRYDRRYHDMDVQLSIQSENKNRYIRWYELTSYYSVITDVMTASRIQAAIEHYREVQ